VVAILVPTLVKSYHGFEDHKHEVCNEKYSTHFHELNLDCEFYKFKVNTNYYQGIETLLFASNLKITEQNTSYYFFLSTHQQDNFYLRGPPSLISYQFKNKLV
jgi:hypothetical protein